MKRVVFVFFMLLSSVPTVFAGPTRIDSLKQELSETNRGIKKLPILLKLAEFYSDSARYHDEAISYLDVALSILDHRHNDSLKIAALNFYGLSEYTASNFEEAATYYYEAITLAEATNDQKQLCKLYNNLGMVFDEIEDYDQAIHFYRKSFEIDSILGNEEGIGMSYLNMAISFQNKMKLDSAFQLNQKALEIAEKHGDSVSIINVINNLGTVEYDRKNYDKSLEYYQRAMSLYKSRCDMEGVATVYSNIGLIYLDKKQYDKALVNFKTALDLATELKMSDFVGDIYSNLSMYYEEVGDYKNAFYYYDLYNVVYDSLLGEAKNRNIRKLEAQYRLDKKQSEIRNLQQLNLDQEQMIKMSKEIQFYLYVIIFLVVVILLAGFLMFNKERKLTRQLQEKTQELKKLNSDKDKFFSIIAHDLKNPFNALISYTSLLKTDIDRFTKKELTQILTDLNTSTERGFNLLENLLYWTRSQTNRIKVYKTNFNLKTIVDDVKDLAESNLEEKNQTISIQIDPSINVFADKDMIATVIRNLVFNSIKFSEPETKIHVEAEKINQKVQLSVIDQGIGIDLEEHSLIFDHQHNLSTNGTNGEMGSGLGLAICHEFVVKNDGIIWVESKKGEGATFRFTIPLSDTTSSNG
ncbi:tetratricopeptide repeat protein [Sunxiuqinia sp. A32]|uniref:tetratricopeptide repeat protein n=1 Tax=Sunxiuqinia sp. A32 TaxID=3461496 RepID=UPI0040463803